MNKLFLIISVFLNYSLYAADLDSCLNTVFPVKSKGESISISKASYIQKLNEKNKVVKVLHSLDYRIQNSICKNKNKILKNIENIVNVKNILKKVEDDCNLVHVSKNIETKNIISEKVVKDIRSELQSYLNNHAILNKMTNVPEFILENLDNSLPDFDKVVESHDLSNYYNSENINNFQLVAIKDDKVLFKLFYNGYIIYDSDCKPSALIQNGKAISFENCGPVKSMSDAYMRLKNDSNYIQQTINRCLQGVTDESVDYNSLNSSNFNYERYCKESNHVLKSLKDPNDLTLFLREFLRLKKSGSDLFNLDFSTDWISKTSMLYHYLEVCHSKNNEINADSKSPSQTIAK